jgi:hypothetical protein
MADDATREIPLPALAAAAVPAKPRPSKPAKAKPKLAEVAKAEPELAEPTKAEPELAEPTKAEPELAGPAKAEPELAEPMMVEAHLSAMPARLGRPRVIAAAVEPARRAAVVAVLNRVVEAGGSALLVTADGGGRSPGLSAQVETLDLVAGERRLGLNRLLVRDPARLIARITRRPAPKGAAPAWARVSGSKPYRMLRPWLLWRVLRHRLSEVRVGDVDHVIIVHQNSWPIAWQLHRRNPAATIAYEIPDDVWLRAGRAVPELSPARPSTKA